MPGSYLVTARGISAGGIEGFDAALEIQLATAAPIPDDVREYETDRVVFSWSATQAGQPYTVQVADAAEFAELMHESSVVRTALDVQLPPGEYHWRVRDSGSQFTEARAVTVRPMPPERVTAQGERGHTSISWSEVEDATSYRVRIVGQQRQGAVLVDEVVTGTKFADPELRPGTYLVQVRSIENDVESLPSDADLVLHPARWWFLLLGLPLLI
jgi:hypothetical protein